MSRKLFVILVTVCFFYIAYPLIFSVAMGGVLSVLFFPWLVRMEKRKIPVSLGSALLTTGITVVLLLPSSFLIFFIAKNVVHQFQVWKRPTEMNNGFKQGLMNIPVVHRFMVWITNQFPISMTELGDAFQDLIVSVGARVAEFLGGIFTHLPGVLMALSVIVVSVYFFLVDGRRLIEFLRTHSCFNPQQTDQMIRSLGEICRSVILASMISGITQALLEIIVCVFTGTPHATLIGAMVFVSSFIPIIGSFPITMGVAIQQLVLGNEAAAGVIVKGGASHGAGIVLALTSVVILGLDNLIRPLFLRGTVNLHPLIAFIAAFGGLQTLGFLGIFLGPILAALFVVTLQVLTQKERKLSL